MDGIMFLFVNTCKIWRIHFVEKSRHGRMLLHSLKCKLFWDGELLSWEANEHMFAHIYDEALSNKWGKNFASLIWNS